jgi:hypothetical protein
MGLFSILFLFLSIYLLNNKDKLISLVFLGIFTFWHYHVFLSRTVWHPHPSIFFSSLSIFLGLISLKSSKLLFLFLSQFSFFIALTIYPSSFFILPVICLNSYLFFKKLNNTSLRSYFLLVYSMLVFFIITYSSQLIFEILNNWPSILAILKHRENLLPINLSRVTTHYWNIFEVFFSLLFNNQHVFWKVLFIIFIIFLLLINKFFKHESDLSNKVFDNFWLLLWILLTPYFLINIDAPYAPHRIDLIVIVFFIFLSIKMKQILNCKKNIYKIILILPIIAFLILFFLHNISLVLPKPGMKDSSSYAFNEIVSEAIIQKIDEYRLNRSDVMIFYHFNRDYLGEDICENDYLGKTRFLAQPIDHLINKKLMIRDSINFKYQSLDNYNAGNRFYFLVYNDYKTGNQCFDKFTQGISEFEGDSFSKLIIKDNFYLSFNNHDFQVLLLEKLLN